MCSEYTIYNLILTYLQSTPVISKSKGPVYSFDITVFSLQRDENECI